MNITIPEFIPEIKPEWKCPALTFEGLTARQGVLLCDALRSIERVSCGICREIYEHLRGDDEENDDVLDILSKAMTIALYPKVFVTYHWREKGYDQFNPELRVLGQQIRLQWVKHILKHLEGPVADEVNRYR